MAKLMDVRHIIIFDGVCNFCNSSVDFIINRDPENVFAFTPMQSEFAQNLMKKYQIVGVSTDTFVLIKNECCYVGSDAALEIAKDLNGFWSSLRVFYVVPRFIRDSVYKLIARNRYKIFGKRDFCMLPTDDVRKRFLGI